MFNFINPTVLFALFAGLLPLLIHFINRKRVKEIDFSTIHFLKEMVRKEMRRLKLRQLFLLIIRILIIILIVLVFARPTFRSTSSFVPGHSSSETVIILDNSLSMNTLELSGILLEKIKQRLSQLEAVFNKRDKISIILGVKPLKTISFRESLSSGLWNKIMDEIQPSQFTGILGESILEANRIFKESEFLNRELYIISDFQKTQNLKKMINQIQDIELNNIRIFLLPIKHTKEENVSIDSVIVLNKMLEKNQILKVACIVHNHHA